ncbi:MAG: nucleotidyltransferase family protein [Lachnospiraceae bacterium]|nr:nucleotidyltransferase family protein [Lachnospiraceae bacterium]
MVIDNSKENLTEEQKLIILCSRLTFREEDVSALQEFKQKKLNWFDILSYCIKNKVVSLVWYNVRRYGLSSMVPNPLFDIFEYHSYMTGLRNEIILSEAHNVQKALIEEGVKSAPLKGLILIPTMYKNPQIRHMNDMDIMIDINSRSKVAKAIEKLGFVQGRPDRNGDRIKPYSRNEQIAWSVSMNNMPLFTKMREERYVRFLEIDFTFGIDFNRKNTAVSTMLQNTVYDENTNFECLSSVDFFIHLCAHLYKEATNASSVIYFQDINLIKFCDVREFFLQNYTEEWYHEVCERAKGFDAVKALYYSLYYSFLVFDDYNYLSLLEKIGVDDLDFMDSFGMHEWGECHKWKKGFYARLFSQSNEDELEEKPEVALI